MKDKFIFLGLLFIILLSLGILIYGTPQELGPSIDVPSLPEEEENYPTPPSTFPLKNEFGNSITICGRVT